MGNLITIFLTGLITGGLTCMAVQGGLLAATLAQREEERLKNNLQKGGHALPIISFLISKLIAYTILGFLLGALGSFFQMSIFTKNILQVAVAIFMIGTALNILEVHPIFRYFIIQPPKFLTRLVRNKSKSQDFFAPAILGAFTVFIPCGTTQAMMALAIASSSPLLGAAILFAFVLGTSPLFFILGYFATKLGEVFQKKFMRLAAFAIILLALFNLNNSLAIAGLNINLSKPLSAIYCVFAVCDNSGETTVQVANNNININIEAFGYSPNTVTVKAGQSVKITLKNIKGSGCIQAFTIPSLGIQRVIPVGSSDTISFTAPKSPTQIPFMCSMGMYRGVINVI